MVDVYRKYNSEKKKMLLKLLSSTSAKIAQGEVLQLQHKGEADLLEDTYIYKYESSDDKTSILPLLSIIDID